MVMVVGQPGFVAGRRAGRFDSPDQTGRGQRVEHVVDRGGGECSEVCARCRRDFIGRRMRCVGDGGKNGEASGGGPQATGAQQIGRPGFVVLVELTPPANA